MEISGDYVFDAPQKPVWDALMDPNVLGAIMPGGKGFEQIAENQYKGALEVKVGPVQGLFQAQITLSDIIVPEHYQIEVDGKGAPGFVKANGKLQLEAQGNQTNMVYSGQAQVGGRIASVGQRLMDSAARSIIRQSLDALNEYLKIQAAQVAAQQIAVTAATTTQETTPALTPAETAARITSSGEFKRPSQVGLGVNVAKDIFSDLVPAKYQPWVIAAVGILILLIIWLIIRR